MPRQVVEKRNKVKDIVYKGLKLIDLDQYLVAMKMLLAKLLKDKEIMFISSTAACGLTQSKRIEKSMRLS